MASLWPQALEKHGRQREWWEGRRPGLRTQGLLGTEVGQGLSRGVTCDQPQGVGAEARAPRDSSDFPRPLGEAFVWCGSPSGPYICWLGDPFS